MSVKVRCCSCGRRRVAFAENITGAAACRFCTERQLAARLGRPVLLSPQGRDSVSGKTFERLLAEANRRGR